ncbi:hypothetical protein B0H14DRAFT_3463556 [Mycena olivaceomarginata]|nr:hypothetical protein B0H14DRAFT_3463556 [Mycena olivaceomarginata]
MSNHRSFRPRPRTGTHNLRNPGFTLVLTTRRWQTSTVAGKRDCKALQSATSSRYMEKGKIEPSSQRSRAPRPPWCATRADSRARSLTLRSRICPQDVGHPLYALCTSFRHAPGAHQSSSCPRLPPLPSRLTSRPALPDLECLRRSTTFEDRTQSELYAPRVLRDSPRFMQPRFARQSPRRPVGELKSSGQIDYPVNNAGVA